VVNLAENKNLALFQDSEHKHFHQYDIILRSCASIRRQSVIGSTYMMSILTEDLSSSYSSLYTQKSTIFDFADMLVGEI